MKSYFLPTVIVALMSIANLSAQNQKEYPVKNAARLSISSNSNIYIHKSDTSRMVVTGDEKEINLVTFQTDENQTSINANNSFAKNSDCEIHYYTNDIKSMQIMGNSTVIFIDEFTTDNVQIDVSGNSDFSGKFSTGYIGLTSSGSSNVTLLGKADSARISATGSSDVDMTNFPVKKADASASGASDIYLDVTEELGAVASGASDILYKNEPPKLSGSTSGASDIGPMKNGDIIRFKNNNDDNTNIKAPDNSPQNSKRFAASWKDMFGGGKWHQSLVWMGIDLGVDGLIDHSNGFDFQPQGDYNFMEMNYARNTHVRINFFEWRFNLVKNVFNIVTGMGFDFHHYAFAQKIKFDEANDYPGQGYTTPVVGLPDTIHSINRSRLAVQYFNIPLFLNLRTKKTAKHKQQFNFTFGVVGGIKTGSSSRIIYSENGRDVEEEKKDDFFLETFTATAMVRIKYSFFSIYASYQFTPMFRGQNPNLYPFSIGVTLLSW